MSGLGPAEKRPPNGFWAQRLDWAVETVDGSVQVRDQARAAVAVGEAHHSAHASGHVFAAASERVAMAMGELTTNGLRHGRPPVSASLARGNRGWLLVVADGAVERPPVPRPQEESGLPTGTGGLGLRLVTSMCLDSGWCIEHGRKLVWALIGDAPPESMVARLDQAIS